VAPSSGWAMSALPLLSADKQTSGEQAINDANDPMRTSDQNGPTLTAGLKMFVFPNLS